MEKSELVASVAKKTNVDEATAEKVVNAVIAEAVSPMIFNRGGQVGCFDTNGCRIPASVLEHQISAPLAEAPPRAMSSELTGAVENAGKTVKVIVQGVEFEH